MSQQELSGERARNMITRLRGNFELPAGSMEKKAQGDWIYKPLSDTSGELHDTAEGFVGRFSYEPCSDDPKLLQGLFTWEEDLNPTKTMRCIGVTNSEIMKHVQLPSSEGAYFVLPSQLNGAEYPSENCVVRNIAEYRFDNTGGPRGQLAVHPAAGQFVLDNAAHRDNPLGLSSVDQILLRTKDFELQNGYLRLPSTSEESEARRMFESFVSELHSLRPLVMHEVPALGLTPDKRGVSEERHRVGLVYASAVPVDAYLNCARTVLARKLHSKVAEAVLVVQYYGALCEAAKQRRKGAARRTKVFLLPLGGGVFNNSWESIARAMAQAVELMAKREPELFGAVEIDALAWEGSPSEKTRLETLLTRYNKLRAQGVAEEASPVPPTTSQQAQQLQLQPQTGASAGGITTSQLAKNTLEHTSGRSSNTPAPVADIRASSTSWPQWVFSLVVAVVTSLLFHMKRVWPLLSAGTPEGSQKGSSLSSSPSVANLSRRRGPRKGKKRRA